MPFDYPADVSKHITVPKESPSARTVSLVSQESTQSLLSELCSIQHGIRREYIPPSSYTLSRGLVLASILHMCIWDHGMSPVQYEYRRYVLTYLKDLRVVMVTNVVFTNLMRSPGSLRIRTYHSSPL
jgi:hypothetical protein